MKDRHSGQDELLAELNKSEIHLPKGKLKIFFGIAPGVGKTYAMCQAALPEADNGANVVIGCVEHRKHSETNELIDKLTIIPHKKVEYKGDFFEEIDMDTILKMRPQLVLIDNLAHVNTPVSRNLRRSQDVQELLDKGIDVYATLNMVHLESCIDTVFQITGMNVTQSLPDEVFEQADEVVLVDITPDVLITRLTEGKIFKGEHSEETLGNFYDPERITAMRTLALHKVTERCNKRKYRCEKPWLSKRRLLVLIEPEHHSMPLIRRTKSIADTIGSEWIALYIETDYALNEKRKKQLADNFDLVRQLKGELITFSGNDLVRASLEVARRENVTLIIVGNPKQKGASRLINKRAIDRLFQKCGNINVYVVGAETEDKYKSPSSRFNQGTAFGKYAATVLFSIATTLLCVPLADKTDYPFSPFVLLLALFIMATLFRFSILYLTNILVIFAVGVLLIPPQFTFRIDTSTDMGTILIYFVVTLINGILATRFREQEARTISREKQTNALFLLTKRLGSTTSIHETIEASLENIQKYFSVESFFIFRDKNKKLTNFRFLPNGVTLSEQEIETARQASKLERATGRFTDISPSCIYTFYPMKGPNMHIGVAALKLNKPMSGKTAFFWDAFLAQIAQMLEHQYLQHLASRTKLLNESDRLYKTLFNTISHEFRIPVTTIMGASDILLGDDQPEHIRTAMYREILEASQRLNRLIENLLNMSRLESGRLAVHLDWCDVNDLFSRVVRGLFEELKPFHLEVVVPESIPLVKLDFGLMEQVVYNLVINSTQWSKPGTTLCLKACYDNNRLAIQLEDSGPGFDPEVLPHVFDKFWRHQNTSTGGLGLGLSIVKGFVEAHKGTITVENRKNEGAKFTIIIPVEIAIENF